jgi:hypothetical protein
MKIRFENDGNKTNYIEMKPFASNNSTKRNLERNLTIRFFNKK